jgi:hypothetical protein
MALVDRTVTFNTFNASPVGLQEAGGSPQKRTPRAKLAPPSQRRLIRDLALSPTLQSPSLAGGGLPDIRAVLSPEEKENPAEENQSSSPATRARSSPAPVPATPVLPQVVPEERKVERVAEAPRSPVRTVDEGVKVAERRGGLLWGLVGLAALLSLAGVMLGSGDWLRAEDAAAQAVESEQASAAPRASPPLLGETIVDAPLVQSYRTSGAEVEGRGEAAVAAAVVAPELPPPSRRARSLVEVVEVAAVSGAQQRLGLMVQEAAAEGGVVQVWVDLRFLPPLHPKFSRLCVTATVLDSPVDPAPHALACFTADETRALLALQASVQASFPSFPAAVQPLATVRGASFGHTQTVSAALMDSRGAKHARTAVFAFDKPPSAAPGPVPTDHLSILLHAAAGTES